MLHYVKDSNSSAVRFLRTLSSPGVLESSKQIYFIGRAMYLGRNPSFLPPFLARHSFVRQYA